MTLLQKLSLAATLSSATFSVATSIPKTILPDNVIRCEPNDACVTKNLYGRNYKVLTTPRFTVMVSISHEGIYTRADVSVTNNTDMPLSVCPEDFRVEVLTPKPKVLLYIPPANLLLPQTQAASRPRPQSPIAAGNAFVTQSPAPPPTPETAANSPSATPEEVDAAVEEAKGKAVEAANKTASEQHLAATSVLPNEAASGRVYFERDKHARLVNVVLPIAGVVFEFPYAMKK